MGGMEKLLLEPRMKKL